MCVSVMSLCVFAIRECLFACVCVCVCFIAVYCFPPQTHVCDSSWGVSLVGIRAIFQPGNWRGGRARRCPWNPIIHNLLAFNIR